jgi:cysteine desulfurase
MNTPVYLDNHATTKVDPRVVRVMIPLMEDDYGNAASRQHAFGWKAEAAVEIARSRVALLVGALPEEVVFTSGATESVNLALKGVAESRRDRGNRIVIAATEHRAVLDTAARLSQDGFDITTLRVDAAGLVDPAMIGKAIGPKTILVSIMAANNEIGTIAPLEEIGALCRERGVLFHTDAAQAAGKIPMDVRAMNIDLLTLSAHKMHGPKGVGALVIRTGVRIAPQIDGGGHERGLRSGTLNVPAIAGFGLAAEIAGKDMKQESESLGALRDRLVEGLGETIEGIRINGHTTQRLPSNANITFPGVTADALMMAMKDIAVSSGSACSSASPGPSHVLLAIGLSPDEASASLRFGLGRFTTREEIDYAIHRVAETHQEVAQRLQHSVHAH